MVKGETRAVEGHRCVASSSKYGRPGAAGQAVRSNSLCFVFRPSSLDMAVVPQLLLILHRPALPCRRLNIGTIVVQTVAPPDHLRAHRNPPTHWHCQCSATTSWLKPPCVRAYGMPQIRMVVISNWHHAHPRPPSLRMSYACHLIPIPSSGYHLSSHRYHNPRITTGRDQRNKTLARC